MTNEVDSRGSHFVLMNYPFQILKL